MKYATGKHAVGICDICGFEYPLNQLKSVVVKRKITNKKACSYCFDEDHPQLFLGEKIIVDGEAIRNPRPETNTNVVNSVVTTVNNAYIGASLDLGVVTVIT